MITTILLAIGCIVVTVVVVVLWSAAVLGARCDGWMKALTSVLKDEDKHADH